VTIGGMTRSELLTALREQGVQLNRAAEALFEDCRFTTLSQPALVAIAAVLVAELGFDQGSPYERLIARAAESGLVQCPLELGPHLRLKLLDQADAADGGPLTQGRAPPGSITIASPPLGEPRDESDETPKGFYLRRVDGAPWLRGYWSSPAHVWSPEDVLVFAIAGAVS
jgi:hypothetical protein